MLLRHLRKGDDKEAFKKSHYMPGPKSVLHQDGEQGWRWGTFKRNESCLGGTIMYTPPNGFLSTLDADMQKEH